MEANKRCSLRFGGFDDKDDNYTLILSVEKYPHFTDTWEKVTDS